MAIQQAFRWQRLVFVLLVLWGLDGVWSGSAARGEGSPAVTVGAAATPLDLRTECEDSDFRSYTSHENMVAYLRQVQARSTQMKLGSYGRSYEGRELMYAVLSRPAVTQPWEALVSGKPIIVLSANVHGGERSFRESLLILLREMATPGTRANAWLDDLVVLVIPSINPDGFVRGTRQNARGVDLNRDYMKLEHQSIVKLVTNIHHKWHPHVIVDGHNGGALPYNVCYQAPSNAASDSALTEFCDKGLFPHLDRVLQGEGYKSFYYSRGNQDRWTTGGSEARIGRNYIGLTNGIGILLESPNGQPTETAVRSGVLAFEAMLEYVVDRGDDVISIVNRARRETVELGQAASGVVPVKMKYEAEDEPVAYEIAQGKGDEKEWVTVHEGRLMKKPMVTAARRRPYAYLLPAEAVQTIELLRRHNITLETLQESIEVEVEAYTLKAIDYEKVYDHAAAVKVSVGDVVTRQEKFPAGTYVVPTGQMMGRVVAHLLEPETDDSAVYWNTMDALLPKAELAAADEDQAPPVLPIYKLMQPKPLPTELLGE